MDDSKPFLAVGELSAERYKGNRGINLIAAELEEDRERVREKA